MSSRPDKFRIVASVCGLLSQAIFVLVLFLGNSVGPVVGAAMWFLSAPLAVYLWLRLDGTRSLFGGLTLVSAMRSIGLGLWILVGGSTVRSSPVIVLDIYVLSIPGVVLYWLLVRLGRGDRALPRLTGIFRVVLVNVIAGAIVEVGPGTSPIIAVAALVSFVSIVWLRVWVVLVCSRLLRENAHGTSAAIGATAG